LPDLDPQKPVFSNECVNLAVQLILKLDDIERYE